jgi:uncharacterized membrane protein
MSLFARKKKYFTPEEDAQILEAVRLSENQTSGEIRIYIESRNPMVEPLDRATQIFAQFEMSKTKNRNGVLIYIAIKDRELAVLGDSGIHEQVGSDYWQKEVAVMLDHFKKHELAKGLIHCVQDIGQVLKEKFPFIPGEDKNELPDDIIFGS